MEPPVPAGAPRRSRAAGRAMPGGPGRPARGSSRSPPSSTEAARDPAPLPLRPPHLVPLRSSPTSRRVPPPLHPAFRKAEIFKNPVTHALTPGRGGGFGGEKWRREARSPALPLARPPKLAKLAAPYPGGRRWRQRPRGGWGGPRADPREAGCSAAGDEARAREPAGGAPCPRRAARGTRGPGAHGRGVRRQPGRRAVMAAREGLASSGPGRSDASREEEERRREGGKEAGRAEGGQREERRTRDEGVSGRGEGKRAAWGWGLRAGGRGAGAGAGESAEGAGGGCAGSRRTPACALSRFPFPSLSASPSRCSRPGLGAPDAASRLPAGAGGEATAKLSATFVAGRGLRGLAGRGRGRGRAAAPGGHTRASSLYPASAATFQPRRTPPPVWWEAVELRARPPGRRLGVGEARPPYRGWSANFCTSCCSVCVTPASVPGTEGCSAFTWSDAPEDRHHSHQQGDGWLVAKDQMEISYKGRQSTTIPYYATGRRGSRRRATDI